MPDEAKIEFHNVLDSIDDLRRSGDEPERLVISDINHFDSEKLEMQSGTIDTESRIAQGFDVEEGDIENGAVLYGDNGGFELIGGAGGEVKTPVCPVCGSMPGDVSFSLAPGQESCPTDECPINTWDKNQGVPY